MADHLGPRLAQRPLHMFWLLDVSGSMGVDGKIEALNSAMRSAVDSVRSAAADNPGTEVLVRTITFAHDAVWHHAVPTDIEDFRWSDVAVVDRGTTETGRAIGLTLDAIEDASQEQRGFPPAIVLVSDGNPTDLKVPTYGAAIRSLMDHPWGRRAARMAIGIGRDADLDSLRRFIGHSEIEPLLATNASELHEYLRWASTVALDLASRVVQDPESLPPANWAPPSPPAPPVPVADAGEAPTVSPSDGVVDAGEAATVLPSDGVVDGGEAATVLPPDGGEAATMLPPQRPAPSGRRRDLPPPEDPDDDGLDGAVTW